ncbi:MAG: hypothetical protein GX596_03260 [Propionibacterium sp.]|nr:hypothetical protein [Propionibacterium sp.]
MADGHPAVWALLVGAVVGIAMTVDDAPTLVVLVASLVVTGFLVRGPRVAAFVHAALLAFAGALVWVAWTLLVPSSAAGSAALAQLPTHTPGAGVRLGGALTVAGLESGVVSALALACALLAVGVAGQVVSARGWLSLARTLLGPLAPAVGWIACGGEASAEVAWLRRQRRGQRGTAALTAWLVACRDIARSLPGVTPRVLLAWRASDLAHLVPAVALLAAWLTVPRLGHLPLVVAALLLPVGALVAGTGRRAAHA